MHSFPAHAVTLIYVLLIMNSLQGIEEGWYDGGSIAFAVLLVIFVTGVETLLWTRVSGLQYEGFSMYDYSITVC